MRTYSKLLFTGLAAAILLAAAVSTASARTIRVSEPNYKAIWRPLTFEAAGTRIECNVTLLGKFDSSTIAKTTDKKGTITHADLSLPCTGGTATILRETLPWDVNYVSFVGTLPNITSVRVALIRASFRVDPTSVFLPACLVRTTAEHPATGDIVISRGLVTGLRANEETRIPLPSGLCELAGESDFVGTGNVTNLPGTASITVTLI
jgi:hypothetical protein